MAVEGKSLSLPTPRPRSLPETDFLELYLVWVGSTREEILSQESEPSSQRADESSGDRNAVPTSASCDFHHPDLPVTERRLSWSGNLSEMALCVQLRVMTPPRGHF